MHRTPVRVWSQIIRISHGQHITTFRESPTDLDGSHYSREKEIPDYIPSTSANRSTGPYLVSLLFSTKEVVGLSQSFCRQQVTRLTVPIWPVCDRYVQYFLADANPSVLNRHRWGLQPPNGPTRSQVIQSQHSLKWNGVKHLSPISGLSTTRHLPKSLSTLRNC
jgi:hypothetical protein